MRTEKPDVEEPAAAPPAPSPGREDPEVVIRYGGEPDEDRIPVTVLLAPRHHDYLAQRAALHGETPERHLETILRNFRAYYDDRRPDLANQPEPQRGGGAVTRRMT